MARARRIGIALGLALACVFCGDVASYAAQEAIGGTNTSAESWYGQPGWVKILDPVVADHGGTVTIEPPAYGGGSTWAVDHPGASSELAVIVWETGDEPAPDGNGYGTPEPVIQVAGDEAPKAFEAEPGQSYTVVLYYYSPESDGGYGIGLQIDYGDTLTRIADPVAATPTPGPVTTPGEDTGLYVDPDSGEVRVNEDVFVGVGVMAFLVSVVLGLQTAHRVLP